VLREEFGANGENFWSGQTLTATGPAGARTHVFPANLPNSSTAGRSVLVATQGFAALGILAPDYVIPNGFLPLTGGSVDFAGIDSVSYAALPSDGTTALDRNGTPVPNRATNFAGASASVVATPPPAVNYQGLFYAAPAESESGWGLNVAHQGDVIFATWFTYDTSGRDWWLSMNLDRQADGSFAGPVSVTRGPAFSSVPFDPLRVTRTVVGSATLRFTDANRGTFAYTVNGITQSKAIVRQAFGAVPSCAFGSLNDLAQATNYQDLWWAAPADSESGWGVNLTHQGTVIFATWFTYDIDGTPMWLSAQLDSASVITGPGTVVPGFAGRLVRTTGPAFSAVPFDPLRVTRTEVGTATLVFANGNRGTFAYTVGAVSQAKTIVRQVFRAPGTACR
jgi:hypothetical protein